MVECLAVSIKGVKSFYLVHVLKLWQLQYGAPGSMGFFQLIKLKYNLNQLFRYTGHFGCSLVATLLDCQRLTISISTKVLLECAAVEF